MTRAKERSSAAALARVALRLWRLAFFGPLDIDLIGFLDQLPVEGCLLRKCR